MPCTVIDYGRGMEAGRNLPSTRTPYTRLGLRPTRRFYQPDSYFFASSLVRLGLERLSVPGILRRHDAALDLSGGDSFTDLYGPRRFDSVCAPKRLAILLRKPLILLPQTYGPFRDTGRRAEASRIVRYAARAWARDARSFEILRDLLGDTFDPTRHRLGVDVAFRLPSIDAPRLREKLPGRFVGVNVSGLIWNNPAGARDRYLFKADYRDAVTRIVGLLARETPVVLVPHVLSPRGHYESDRSAAEDLVASLSPDVRANVHVCSDPADPCEAKGLIARCDWFMGTRMHATIAGLSSGVATAAISYSDKTLGVFETCGQGSHVHDPRRLATDELVERVLASYRDRDAARASLAIGLPPVLATADEQMDEIARTILALSPREASLGTRVQEA